MDNIMIFPYHPDIDILVAWMDYIESVHIVGVCSFKEDSFTTNEINKKLDGILDFDEIFEKSDTVLFLDNYRHCKPEKYYEVMKRAVAFHKKLIFTPLAEKELDLKRHIENYDILEKVPVLDVPETELIKHQGSKKYDIDIPIISILGMGKNCGKFETQLLIKTAFDKRGYHAVWLSSNPLSAFFQGYTMPDFMYNDKMGFQEKVLKFNNFMYGLSIVEKPDVFIIGVPEGILEFERFEYNHFAEYPLVIGSAVQTDFAILNTYFLDNPSASGIQKLIKRVSAKFNFPVKGIAIGKSGYEAAEGKKEMEYSYFDNSYMNHHYRSMSECLFPVLTLWDFGNSMDLVDMIIKQLQGNLDVL